jgi:hypothetical protein
VWSVITFAAKPTFVLLIFYLKLFISNQNYIRFYKLICCDSVWREEAYPKISPINLLLGRLAIVLLISADI